MKVILEHHHGLAGSWTTWKQKLTPAQERLLRKMLWDDDDLELPSEIYLPEDSH